LSLTSPAPDPAALRERVLERIAKAARVAGRDPAGVTLTAVTKGQAREAVAALLGAGQTVFGENRVQEAEGRWATPRAGIALRLIGPLQTNKAAKAAQLFDVIETVDRWRLAAALAEQSERLGRPIAIYIQVNTGEEPQKAGLPPREADAFIASCRRTVGLSPRGLMCIPPAAEPAAPHFALLAKIAAANGLAELSMGMSGDFETAIRFGATHVRIGSALFGGRSAAPAHA
jgi:PLP dependent protein